MLTKAALFEQKYNKNRNIEKYYLILEFKITVFFLIDFKV